MKVLFFLALILSVPAFAENAEKPGKVQKAVKKKAKKANTAKMPLPACSEKELKIKECILNWKQFRAGVSPQKIRFTWGAWTSIADFPGKDKATEWNEIRIEEHLGRTFLTLKVWQKLENEVALEELHWFVMEPQETTLKLHVDQVVGKRKMEADGRPAKIQDALQSTQLLVEKDAHKNDQLRWKVGNQSGEISHGI